MQPLSLGYVGVGDGLIRQPTHGFLYSISSPLTHMVYLLPFLSKTPPAGVLPIFQGARRPASSSSLFVTKWGSGISRERFDLVSPNFTWTFTLVGSTTHRIWRHYILPVGSYRRSKMGRNWRLRRLQPIIAKIGTYIHTNILISCTGYDVTDYFWLGVTEV